MLSLRVQAFVTATVIVALPMFWAMRIVQHPTASLSAWMTRTLPLVAFMFYAWHAFPWFIPGYYVRVLVASSVIAVALLDARGSYRAVGATEMSQWDITVSAIVCAGFVVMSVWMTWPQSDTVLDLRSPVSEGEFIVTQGGRTRVLNHHVGAEAQRYAVDIVRIGRGGMRATGIAPASLASYYAYGTRVVSPVDGVVAEVRDGIADNAPGVRNDATLEGNFVVLVTSSGARVMLAHFQRGSLMVQAGQNVTAGTALGRIGNSGNTSEPHLHVQVNDREGAAVPFTIAGIALTRHARVTAALDQQGASAP